jgi:hypothetical protein
MVKQKKIMNNMVSGAVGMTAAGATMGIGGSIIGAAGGNPAVMTGMSSMMPAAGVAMGGGYALGMLGGLANAGKMQKRRRR